MSTSTYAVIKSPIEAPPMRAPELTVTTANTTATPANTPMSPGRTITMITSPVQSLPMKGPAVTTTTTTTPGDTQLPEFKSNSFWKETDFQMSARIHLRHWMWDYHLGYTMHPKITIPKDRPTRIADVACNNGAWMLDIARQYPYAKIQGFDVSASNFPHESWWLPNMSFKTWDALTAVPDEFIGYFDVVHIGTIFSAIHNNNVGPVIDNILKMLKPGGYVQWVESNPLSTVADLPVPCKTDGAASKLMTAFFRAAHTWQGVLDDQWLRDLGKSLIAKKCTLLDDCEVAPKCELQRAWCDNWLTIWFGMVAEIPEKPKAIPKTDGLPSTISRDWFVDLLHKTAEECAQGVWLKADQRVVVARKAL